MTIDDIRRASAQRKDLANKHLVATSRVPGVGTASARRRLEAALCALVDYEREIKETMALSGGGESYSQVCDALSDLAEED